MSLGFGFSFPAWRSINGATPPMPGFPFIVLASDGTSYSVTNVVLSSAGVGYAVIPQVLDSAGNVYNPI